MSAPSGPTSAAEPAYGFYDRLNAAFPSQILIDMTEVCNLACIHCPHPTFKKTELYTGAHLDAALSAKAVDEVREHGRGICQYIRFTGNGEPLIHPNVFEMLRYAVERSGTTVTLTTNGTILTKKRLQDLVDTGVHVIDVSIDAASPETYAKVRVQGNLDVTRANVSALLAAVRGSGGRQKVIVSYVEQPENTHETADFTRYWKDQGAENVVVRRLHSNAGAIEGIAVQLRRAAEKEARRPCLYPWERLTLTPKGELQFCPQDWVYKSVLADYRKTTIQETWTGETYKKLREAHLTNDYSQHAFCGNCPDWRNTAWPKREGRSYADVVQDLKKPK